jgi:hypothetical protein
MGGTAGRHLGVTLMPEYLQCEGIEPVLDRLEKLGVTAVTTMPSVAREVPAGQGSREPPLDAGAGAVRVLDRPLWGKLALHMVTAPSFVPNRSLYAGLAYQPPEPSDLTATQGPLVAQFIAAAKRRGLKVYLQVMAAIPPCYRVQFGGPTEFDRPMLPRALPLPARVDNNASLAAGAVRDYVRVMIADLCIAYPDVDGFRFDWPEYPPYHLLSLLADYNPQVRPLAEAAGFDFTRLEAQIGTLHQQLISGSLPSSLFEPGLGFDALLGRLSNHNGAIADHFMLRRHLVEDYARFLRACVREAGGDHKQMFLQCFPPPWNSLSGFTPSRMAGVADLIGVKFYTMHWPMMLRQYADRLAGFTGGDADAAARAGYRLFVDAQATDDQLQQIAYPEPDEPHRIPSSVIEEKFCQLQSVSVDALIAVTHAYGPVDDVCQRLSAAWRASSGRIEINRYGYMSDAKIAAMADTIASLN